MNDFFPLNELERMLTDAKENKIPIEIFVRQLASFELALPSAGVVQEDGSGFQPIVFDKQGEKMLAAFTDKSRAVQLKHIAQYCLVMNALEVFRRIPPKHGVVINPGLTVGLELSPTGIAQLVKDLV